MSNEIWKMIPFFLPDKVPMKIFLLCLVVLLSGIAAAQKSKPGTVDTALLRTKLKAPFSDHLAIIKHETTRRSNWHGGQLFWLVYVQPKRVGHFSIKYRYNYNGSLYSHVERELPFRVGEQGCLRGPQGHGLYSKFCLGDTIILPIAIENFTEHEFSLKFTDEDIRDEPFSSSADRHLGSDRLIRLLIILTTSVVVLTSCRIAPAATRSSAMQGLKHVRPDGSIWH